MNQQVVPLLCEFKDILEGKGSLFLNLQNAGGMNFWGVFLFFISSPFTFLVAFVEKWQMMRFANILVLLKIMLCAGCASVFFDRIFPKLRPFFTVLLSISYAFCGYTMLFYQNMRMAGYDVSVPALSAFPASSGKNRLLSAICFLPGRHDHREFLFGIYGGSVSDFGRRHLGFLFLSAYHPGRTDYPAGCRHAGSGFALRSRLAAGAFTVSNFCPRRKPVPKSGQRSAL